MYEKGNKEKREIKEKNKGNINENKMRKERNK